MCAKLKFNEHEVILGHQVPVHSAIKLNGFGKWTGFIKSDADKRAKGFWFYKGFKSLLDVPASNVTVYSKKRRKVILIDLPADHVVYAVGNRKNGEIRLLTKKSTEEELKEFGSERIPLIGEKRFD